MKQHELPVRRDIKLYSDRKFSEAFKIWDDKSNNIAKDITGWGIKSQIRSRTSGRPLIAEFTITRDDSNGQFIRSLSGTEINSIVNGVYEADIAIATDGVNYETWFYGSATKTDSVTDV